MITKPYLEIFYPSSSTGSYLLDRASHCGFTYADLRPLDPALDIWSNFVKKEKKNPFTSCDCDFFCLDLFSFLKRLPCGNGLVACIYHSNDLVSSSYPMPVQCEFILTFLVDLILKNNTFEKYQKFCTFK